MAANDPITASNFNNLRDDLENYFGPTMYGIPVGTAISNIPNTVTGGSDPATSDTVLAADVERLFGISQLVYYHQLGVQKTVTGTTFPDFSDGQIIYWADWGEAGDVQGIYDIINDIKTWDRHNTDFLGDFSTIDTAIDAYTTNWGNTNTTDVLERTIFFSWNSAQEMTNFFMMGGELRISLSASGGNVGTTGTKDDNWALMLSNTGNITLKLQPNAAGTSYEWVSFASGGGGTGATQTTTNPSGPVNSGSEYLGYNRAGSGSIYDDNTYQAYYTITNSSVSIRLVLTDGDEGTDNPADGADRTPIDEPVTAEISGTAQISYASSSITLADNAAVNHVFSLPNKSPSTTNAGSWAVS